MQIVLAKFQDRLSPLMRWHKVPVALMWLNEGTGEDLAKAKEFAKGEEYEVFTYFNEPDPIGKAKQDLEANLVGTK